MTVLTYHIFYCLDPEIDDAGKCTLKGSKISRIYANNENITSADLSKGTFKYLPESLFANCSNLETVKLCETIEIIESYAFHDCEKLSSINFPSSLKYIGHQAFIYCYSITSISLENTKVEYIGNFSFSETNFNKFVCPRTLKVIGSFAFYYNYGMTTFECNENLIEIQEYAFADCVALKDFKNSSSLKILREYAFYSSRINQFDFPKNVNIINRHLFESSELLNIELHNNIVAILDYAFSNCANLQSIRLPPNIALIGAFSFARSSLIEFTVPSKVNIINYGLFASCGLLETINMHDDIIEIRDYAFYSCQNLVNINFPINLNHLGAYSFSMTSFTEFTIPHSITSINEGLFQFCNMLNNLILHEGILSIHDYAFANCPALKNIEIPRSVTSIGNYAFYYSSMNETSKNSFENIEVFGEFCFENSKIETFECPENLKIIKRFAFSYCQDLVKFIPNTNLIEIQENSFSFCPKLESFVLPDSVKTIGKFAFKGCSQFQSFKIPKGTLTLNEGLFSDCSNLNTIVFHDDIERIEADVFTQCSKINSLTIPSKIKYIGENTFRDINLAIINLPSLLEVIDNYAFSNSDISRIEIPASVKSIGDNAFANCQYLETVIIHSNSIQLGLGVFSGCDNLDNIEFSDSNNLPIGAYSGWSKILKLEDRSLKIHQGNDKANIKTISLNIQNAIPNNFFSYCSNLMSVIIPSNVEQIGKNSFIGCSNLEEIIFPSTINFIGEYAFYKCYHLNDFTIPSSNISIGRNAFLSTNITTISYPSIGNRLPNGAYTGTRIAELDLTNYISIGNYACCECYMLTKVILSQSITEIPEYCFYQCRILYSINIENVVSFGDYSFYKTRIALSFINKSLKYIGNYSFTINPGIENIDLSDMECEIGQGCFYEWVKLKSIVFPSNLKILPIEILRNCQSLKNVCIPDSVEIIDALAFFNTSLTEINLPKSLISIGQYAFGGCGIQKLILPQGTQVLNSYMLENKKMEIVEINLKLKRFKERCFSNCKIPSLTIPNNCYVENQAFYKCQINNVYFGSDCFIREKAFLDCKITRITINSEMKMEFPFWKFYYSFNLIDYTYCGTEDIKDQNTCMNIIRSANSITTSFGYKSETFCSLNITQKVSSSCQSNLIEPTLLGERSIISFYITFLIDLMMSLK